MNRVLPGVPNAGGGLDSNANSFDTPYGVTTFAGTGGAGVCPLQGYVFLNGSSLSALTLATPVAGLPSAGGNDGQEIKIVAITAHAHTITAASNCINGATDHIITFAADALSICWLVAMGGVWYVVYETNVTLS